MHITTHHSKKFHEPWKKEKLGNLVEFKNGLNFRTGESGDEVLLVGVSEFKDSFILDENRLPMISVNSLPEDYLLQSGDFLFVRSNGNKELIGRVLFAKNVTKKITFSGFTIRARNKSNVILDEYCATFCSSPLVKKQFVTKGGGTNINNLNQQLLSDIEILIPPIQEQREILRILNLWNKAIELKGKLIEQKKEQKKGLMQRLLTGKVRLPGFEGEWEKSKLGKHIKEWADGGTPPKNKKEYFGGNINWVVIDDIQRYIYTTKETLTEEGLLKCSSKYWPEGTVILSTGATIGLVGITKVKTATKQGITGIVTNNTLFNEYLRYWLLNNRELLLRYAQGSSIKEIRTNTLSKMDILLPSLEEQIAISKVLITFENQIELLERELRELQLQKKGLMQLLLTGKVRVKC